MLFCRVLQNMNVGNKENSVLQRPIINNAQKGCDSGDACRSNPCTPRATCVNEWEGYTCTCPNGKIAGLTYKCHVTLKYLSFLLFVN